jgi:hypothetical protein
MKRLNWNVIHSNIQEAREQLEDLEKRMSASRKPNEQDLQISLAHATHHINFAWNTRRIPISKYREMSDRNFKEWGKHPEAFDFMIEE